MTEDRTTMLGSIGLTLVIALLGAAVADERLAKYAVYLLALKTALNDVGLILARSKNMSDQQAGARIPAPGGGYQDAKPVAPEVDFMTNIGEFGGKRP